MSAPPDTDVIAWLRAQGVDPDIVVAESMRGARIANSDRCLLLFVESTSTGGYVARRLEVDIPPWALPSSAAEDTRTEHISAAHRIVMSDNLETWLHSEDRDSDSGDQ